MFSSSLPTLMHIDLNSCFATVEQQANPLLRGKPIVVAAYTTDRGCILAASVEAKRLGIKTGMRVGEGKSLYPRLVVLSPDPEKYRWVNRKLRTLLSSYTPHLSVESIDEMVMDLANTPALERHIKVLTGPRPVNNAMISIGINIKKRIKEEIGEWLTVSIGIAPNRYLAKVASGLHKPDGLDVITKENIEEILTGLQLEDLCGIKEGNAGRLRLAGITTPVEFYQSSAVTLVGALHSKTGWDWWQRLHGYETIPFDVPEQKTYGQSFALGTFRVPSDPEIVKIMAQLIVKMARRLRSAGFVAHGIAVSLLFADYSHWVKNARRCEPLFADSDFLKETRGLLIQAPAKPIRILAVTSFNLTPRGTGQISMWNTDERKWRITDAIDAIANRWGEFTIMPAIMFGVEQKVLDRIAFGRIKDLEVTVCKKS